MQEIEQLKLDLLIVGPSKTHTKQCAKQTANAFLEIARTSNLLRIPTVASSRLRQLRHKNDRENLDDAIMYPHAFELFAFSKSTFVDPSIAEKIRC